MKNILFTLLAISLPFLSIGQQKAAKKADAAPVGNSSLQAQPDNSGNLCKINGDGVRLALSGRGFDAEGVTDKNGNFIFQNVPAGDMVITKTGEDNEAITCKFIITCQGPSKSYTKTGTFKQLTQGMSFKMALPGSVTFGIK